MTAATLAPPDSAVIEVDPVHVAGLAGLTTITDQVRYACEHGPGPRTNEVQQWLAAYGIETRRPYVSTLVNGYRRTPDQPAPADPEPEGVEPVGDECDTADDAEPAGNEPDPVGAVATAEPTPAPRLDAHGAAVATHPDRSDTLPAEPGPEPVAHPVAVETPEPPPMVPVETPPVIGEAVSTDAGPLRSIRSGPLASLLAAAAASAAGVLYALHHRIDVTGWPWPLTLTAGVAVLVTVCVLVWAAGTVLGALVAGRSARDLALDLASWTVAGVAGYLAAYGQVRFAGWAGITGGTRLLVPGILEPSVVVLLLLANRRVKRRLAGQPAKPVGRLLALAASLGGFAVYTNVVHAGGRAGLVFGAATVVGLILWWVKLQDDAAPSDWDDQPQSRRLSRRTARYRLIRWLILPGQTRRAWLISLDHSVTDAEIGLDLARRWRRAYDEARRAKVSRRGAARQATEYLDEYLHITR